MDGWDDKSMRAYIAVTAHYLTRNVLIDTRSSKADGDLTLKSALIGFLPMPGRHYGHELAKGLVFVTDRTEITEKVCSLFIAEFPLIETVQIIFITRDGAANMSAMVHDFKIMLQDRFIESDSTEAHIMLVCHTIKFSPFLNTFQLLPTSTTYNSFDYAS